MPCQTPFRDDSAQVLLFKIASCIEAGGGGGGVAGVTSFNGRTGVVTLTAGDVSTAIGCTPACANNVVTSFNGRQGVVTLNSGDVTTALGFTPLNITTGDARYVLKTGDTMTGALAIGNGVLVASTPYLNLSQTWNNGAVTFTGLQSNVTNTASDANSNIFNFQVDGVDRFNFTPGGSLRAVRQDASDSGLNLFLRKRGNAGGATNAVASDATIGTVAYSGWDGTAFATGARISGEASEAWTNIAHGSRIRFYTTPIGSTTEQITLHLGSAGQAQFLDGTAALPALTFQSDPDTGIYRIGANSFGLSAGGSLILATSTTGVNLTTALAYQYNSVNVIRAQTALSNYFFGPSGNLTMTGAENTSFGSTAFSSNTSGLRNVAIGSAALFANTIGNNNLALGYLVLSSNVSGDQATGVGSQALQSSTGNNNTGIGAVAFPNLTSGTNNTAIGRNTGGGITTGVSNTIIGANVGGLAAALSNNIILADGAGVIRLQIDSSGNTTLAGTVQTAAGTAALPAFSFTADPNTGLYNIGADILGFSTAGTARWQISAAGNFLATTDNTYDIGTTGANRPRNVWIAGGVTAGGGVSGGNITALGAAGFYQIGTRFFMDATVGDGILAFHNNAGSDFNRLQFGGTTSSFPSIKRNGAGLDFRLADDSGYALITTDGITMSVASKLSITSGTNQRAGNAVLVAGTVTVANTTVTANTIVIVTRKTSGGTIGFAVTYTVIAATSFTLTSDSALDTSTYSYLLIEVP